MLNLDRPYLAVLALAVALASTALPAHAQDPAKPPAPGAPAPAAAPAKPWFFPQESRAAGRRLVVQEPIVLAHDPGAGTVTLRLAIGAVDPLGKTTWGSADATGTTRVDIDSRLVQVDGVVLTGSAFPALGEEDAKAMAAALPDALPKVLTLRLEIFTARPGAAPAKADTQGLSSLAPALHVRRTPAVLMQTDGEPVLLDVGEFPLKYLANSASDVFFDPKTDMWFLLLDGTWAQSKALAGPWIPLEVPLPSVLSQINITHPRGHVRRWVPGTSEFKKAGPVAPKALPEIIVADRPAELVLLAGDPMFTLVPRVKLMVVANTESDLFFHPRLGAYFLLVSGRWFTAEDISGTWKEHFGALPEEFAGIPRDHVRAHALWCVPGTPEAQEAVAHTLLETSVTLHKALALEVRYEANEIRTAPLEGSDAKVVTNTEDDVFLADGAYWCCARGVWFRSDDGRMAWKQAIAVPESLQRIPASSGPFHVNFCRAKGAAEEGNSYSVRDGYDGVFLANGAPVHGTGWWRRGLLRGGNWYPSPRTYGESRWYDPISAVFHPRTARYRDGWSLVADEWSPYTASYGRVRHYADRYEQGGRRMYPFVPEQNRFDTEAGRTDVFDRWMNSVRLREGLDPKTFPLGDRTDEPARTEPAVIADATGKPWRLGAGAKAAETWDGTNWVPGQCPPEVLPWLEALARIDARPAQLRSWRDKRAAPLPINPVVTPER